MLGCSEARGRILRAAARGHLHRQQPRHPLQRPCLLCSSRSSSSTSAVGLPRVLLHLPIRGQRGPRPALPLQACPGASSLEDFGHRGVPTMQPLSSATSYPLPTPPPPLWCIFLCQFSLLGNGQGCRRTPPFKRIPCQTGFLFPFPTQEPYSWEVPALDFPSLPAMLSSLASPQQPRHQDEAPGSAAGPGGAGAAGPSVHHSRTGGTGRADEEEATQLSEGYVVPRATVSGLQEEAAGPGRSQGRPGEARGAAGPGGCDGGSSRRSTAAQEATEGGHGAAASRGGTKRRLLPSWSAKTKPQEKKKQPGGNAEAETTEGINRDTGAGSSSGNRGTGTAALMGEGTTTEKGIPSRSREAHLPPINAAVGPGGAAPRADGSSSGPPRQQQQQQQGSTPLLRASHPGRPKAKGSIRSGCGAFWLATKAEVADCSDEDLLEACRAALQKQQQQQQRSNAQVGRAQQPTCSSSPRQASGYILLHPAVTTLNCTLNSSQKPRCSDLSHDETLASSASCC